MVDAYLREEVRLDRVIPVPADEVGTHIQTSPFGVIPKKRNSGKWWLIVNLSAPEGMSVNDGIDKTLCSLAYVSFDTVVDSILSLGRGTEMAKMDVKQAYRMVPVCPKIAPCWA